DIDGLPESVRIEDSEETMVLSPEEIDQADVDDARRITLIDPNGRLTPLGLGDLLNELSEDRDDSLQSIELNYDGDCEWMPEVFDSLEPILESCLISFVRQSARYDESTDTLRTLMRCCDDLLSALPSVSETGDQLDSLLWEWFQEPPTPENFVETINDIMRDMMANQFS
ncbi:MAG: hypothetical protein ABEK50_11205, partial [bacterium]